MAEENNYTRECFRCCPVQVIPYFNVSVLNRNLLDLHIFIIRAPDIDRVIEKIYEMSKKFNDAIPINSEDYPRFISSVWAEKNKI